MIKDSRLQQIADLKAALQATEGLSREALSAQIQKIGFKCQACGECCYGKDNSVVVFPFEIRKIMALTCLDWLQAVQPPMEGEWDKDGNFHTLEWRLKKTEDSCRFYQDNKCRIYEARPMLCSTYPFYLDNAILQYSECRGIGQHIDLEEAQEIANRLIERHQTEIIEAIHLLERYKDFERGEATDRSKCIVHDSEGEHCFLH